MSAFETFIAKCNEFNLVQLREQYQYTGECMGEAETHDERRSHKDDLTILDAIATYRFGPSWFDQ